MVWDNSKEFVGSTPTAPFAKLGLYINSLEVVNGVKVGLLRERGLSNLSYHLVPCRVHLAPPTYSATCNVIAVV